MMLVLILVGLSAVVPLSDATLSCLSCKDVRNVTECVNTVTCGQFEKCYTATSGNLGDRNFTLGCESEQKCNGVSATAGLIGRKKRSANDTNCHQCCGVDGCNVNLCSNIDHVTVNSGELCEDNPEINCSQLSSVIPVCADVHHAKTICKKWCGLCGLVDGSWSDWSAWSSCSVTCDDGHMTRTRTCSDPPPSHGGHNCIGPKTDNLTCHYRTPCQVNGGWGAWLPWGPCSVSQGTGLRRRHRNCDNPAPTNNGYHCYGDVNDFDICKRDGANITFHIRDVQNKDIAVGAKILFKTTLWDTTGSYNTRTGVFTAPVTGLYSFTVAVTVEPKHTIGLQIKTTSWQAHLGQLLHYNNFEDTTSSMTGVGELKAGSQVWVQCLYSGGAGADLHDYQVYGQENSFKGILIHAL